MRDPRFSRTLRAESECPISRGSALRGLMATPVCLELCGHRLVWIAVIVVIAFIAVCEIVRFARGNLPPLAKLYRLGYFVRSAGEASRTNFSR